MSSSCHLHIIFICLVPNTGTRLVILDVLVAMLGGGIAPHQTMGYHLTEEVLAISHRWADEFTGCLYSLPLKMALALWSTVSLTKINRYRITTPTLSLVNNVTKLTVTFLGKPIEVLCASPKSAQSDWIYSITSCSRLLGAYGIMRSTTLLFRASRN